MSTRLPESVDPWRLASRQASIDGESELRLLPRLVEAVAEAPGTLKYHLGFYTDERKRVRISGAVKARLVLGCQRCLGLMELPVDAKVDLAVIEADAQAALLPEECEPVLAVNGQIRISELVEDELLLALPQIPVHPEGDCRIPLDPRESTQLVTDERESETGNPFAVLASLKATGKDNS